MEDLIWRKKSSQRFRYLMLFLIRLAEVLTASIIPSIIGLITVFITPKERVMQTMEVISLIAFAATNTVFWVRYIKHRPNLREFYIMNGIVFMLYASFSVLAYMSSDVYLYSILFSDMRGLEIFGCSTLESLCGVHLILLSMMIISGVITYCICKRKVGLALENSAEAPEIEEKEIVPEKDNKEVEFLTVDEVNLELEREIEEAAEIIRAEKANVPDKNWDDGMVKGKGADIIEATPDDPDNDIEDSDYVSEAYAREEMSVTLNYDVDSLWNKDIYENREIASDYGREEYTPEMFISEDDDYELWDSAMYRGRNKDEGIEYDEETEKYTPDWDDEDDAEPLFHIEYDDEPEEYISNSLEDYDSDSLWGDFKQGR